MKKLRQNFQRSRLISAGFLASVAGILLSAPAPAVHAGQIPSPPRWIRFELDAISLYNAGIHQEISNPQAAATTLRLARQNSTAAIANGGGANWAVLRNDQLIAQALMLAASDAARTPENKQAADNQTQTQTQRSGGIKLARSAGNHSQAPIKSVVK